MAGPSIAKDLQNTLREAFATAERMRHDATLKLFEALRNVCREP